MTPFGAAYDPTTWREAGYNPIIYEQLMEQKMIVAQQKAMLKQQQMLQKMQQQNAKNKNSNNNSLTLTPGTGNQPNPFLTHPRPARKKRHLKKGPATASTITPAKSATNDAAQPDASKGTATGGSPTVPDPSADAAKDATAGTPKAKPTHQPGEKTP